MFQSIIIKSNQLTDIVILNSNDLKKNNSHTWDTDLDPRQRVVSRLITVDIDWEDLTSVVDAFVLRPAIDKHYLLQ